MEYYYRSLGVLVNVFTFLLVGMLLIGLMLVLIYWPKPTALDYIRWGIVPPFPTTTVTRTEPRVVERVIERTTVIHNTYNTNTLVYVPPAVVRRPAYGWGCPPDCDCY